MKKKIDVRGFIFDVCIFYLFVIESDLTRKTAISSSQQSETISMISKLSSIQRKYPRDYDREETLVRTSRIII